MGPYLPLKGQIPLGSTFSDGKTIVLAKNPYQVLGLSQSARDGDIRSAFRKLAKKYHPDRNPDDKKSEERFKEVAAAFDIIGDADRRKRFDRGEIDADGRERGYAGAGGFSGWGSANAGAGGQAAGGPTGGPTGGFDDLGDIFADLFGGKGGAFGAGRGGDGYGHGYGNAPRGGGRAAARGRDLRYRLDVDFLEAVRGAKKRVTMPDGRSLDLNVPAGLDNGQTLRLRGQGEAGAGGGPAGDVYVEISVRPHEVFDRDGNDIHIDVPISLSEAVLGAKITAPTIAGDVALSIPKSTSSGAVLRLRGRGIDPGKGGKTGDQYIKLKIVLPEDGDEELEEFVRGWKNGAAQVPRKHFAGV